MALLPLGIVEAVAVLAEEATVRRSESEERGALAEQVGTDGRREARELQEEEAAVAVRRSERSERKARAVQEEQQRCESEARTLEKTELAGQVVTLAGFQDWRVRNPRLASQLSAKHLRGVKSCEFHALLAPDTNLLDASSFRAVAGSARHQRSHGEETAALNKLREIHGLRRCYPCEQLKGKSRAPAHAQTVLWVQCDACSKWRTLGAAAARDPRLSQPTLSWLCGMNPDRWHNTCEAPEEPWGRPTPNLKLRVGAYVRMPGSRFVSAAGSPWFVGKVAWQRQHFWVVVYNDGDVEEFDERDPVQRNELREYLVLPKDVPPEQKTLLDAAALEAEDEEPKHAGQPQAEKAPAATHAAPRTNKRNTRRLRPMEQDKSTAPHERTRRTPSVDSAARVDVDARKRRKATAEQANSAAPRQGKRRSHTVRPAAHVPAGKRRKAAAASEHLGQYRRTAEKDSDNSNSNGRRPLDEQLRRGECYLLQADVAAGQEKHPIPVYGPCPGHPTPAGGSREFRYTASSEWCTSQPPDWPLVPARRRGNCPCWRWAPSSFFAVELCIEGSERPPTVRAMKQQLVETLSRDQEECEISVDVTTYSGVPSDESDLPMRSSNASRRGSRSRQQPQAARTSSYISSSYSSYSSRMPGSSLVGGCINQLFDVAGSSPRWFRGQVAEYSPATESYLVCYEDGEQRSLTVAEVLEHLEEPDEAVESRWLRVPSSQAAYRSCHTLRQISVATGCDYSTLRKLNARHFPDLALREGNAECIKFLPKTYVQLPHEPRQSSKHTKPAGNGNSGHQSLPLEYVYIRSIHIECCIDFEQAKRALRSLAPGCSVLECVDKTAMSKLEGDAPANLQPYCGAEAGSTQAGAASTKIGDSDTTQAAETGDDDVESWDVEKIVGKGRSAADGTVLYRVRWLGYPSSSDTWQTVEDLTGSADAIAAYERRPRNKALQTVPEDEYSSDILARGPLLEVDEVDLLQVGTKLWLRWDDDSQEYHQGEITRVSATPGWYDMRFEAIVLEGGGRTRCFHLSRYVAEKKVCWTSSAQGGSLHDAEGQGTPHPSATVPPASEQNQLCQQGYYDSHQRLRFWTQLPVRECSAWCGCSRNCVNRVVQKGIHVRGLTIQWMGKKGWGVFTVEPLAAGSFICEYAGQVKSSNNSSEDASNRFTLGLPGGQHVIDAQSAGNLGRFLNHACEPTANCLYQAVILDGSPAQRVGIFTMKPVPANTELTVNYGSSFCQPKKTAQTSSRCLCSPSCTNWIAII
jgi:hypothetical protein